MQKVIKVTHLNRKECVCKMQNILNNRSTFQKVYVDQDKISNWLILSIWKIEKQMFWKILKAKKLISNERDKDLRPFGVKLGIMYGLAKVRKIVTAGLPSFDQFCSTGRTSKNFKILIPNLLWIALT